MALAATVISIVTFILFLFITILAFMAYGQIDLTVCSAQSAILQDARQYLLGVAIVNLIMMLVIIGAAIAGWGSLFERVKGVSTAFVVLALFYVITLFMTCILSAIAYARIVSANCNLSTNPTAEINALVLTIGAGILAILYVLFLLIWYRDDLRKLFRGDSEEGGKVKPEKIRKGLSQEEEEKLGEKILKDLESGRRDLAKITVGEERLLEKAADRRERLQRLKRKAGLEQKQEEETRKRREEEYRRKREEETEKSERERRVRFEEERQKQRGELIKELTKAKNGGPGLFESRTKTPKRIAFSEPSTDPLGGLATMRKEVERVTTEGRGLA